MAGLLRNGEYRRTATALAALLLAATVAFCGLSLYEAGLTHSRAVEQSAALLGKAVSLRPDLEKELASAMVAKATTADIDRGRQLLAAYGYSPDSPVYADPILEGMNPWMLGCVIGFMLLLSAAVFCLVTQGYRGVYRRVRTIAVAAEKVVDGNFSVQLPASKEGEFDILGHRFNQMANRLKLSMEQLQNEKVFLKNIISDISHQLKTPLASLIVYNDLLAADENMDAAQRMNFLEMERLQLQRLERLIQSLLKVARLEAGSIEFRRDAVPLRLVAEAAASALHAMAGEASVRLMIREKHPDAVCTGDSEWLEEAVINVIKNSVEHSKPGGSIEITVDRTPLTATLSVLDRGEGISRADLPHVFERFYRGSRSVKPNSIGIGLALSKAIVEGQGGSISVRSELGKGSEFIVTFLNTENGKGDKHDSDTGRSSFTRPGV